MFAFVVQAATGTFQGAQNEVIRTNIGKEGSIGVRHLLLQEFGILPSPHDTDFDVVS